VTLRIGSKAPPFLLDSTEGRIALDDYGGEWLVVYFYPRAHTSGCTRETIRFQESHPEIRALGASVLGVSQDELPTQCDFSSRHAVSFPLLADPDGKMSKSYGAARPLLPFGRRVTYVIDPEQTVRAVFRHELRPTRHAEDVIAFLERHARAT
jgi:thioredoxin-dependent peroxiredoxin